MIGTTIEVILEELKECFEEIGKKMVDLKKEADVLASKCEKYSKYLEKVLESLEKEK